MTDSENENEDNLENKKNNKYDDKFKYYNFDDNAMHTIYLKNSEIDKVKVYKVNTSVTLYTLGDTA